MGVEFDRWQDDVGRAALALREDGKYAAGVGGVVLSIPRQVGKTFFVGVVVFSMCLNRPGTKAIWTAHHTATADETFMLMEEFAALKHVSPHVLRVRRPGIGKQYITFKNGSRIDFGAREHRFGRGKAKVDILVLDEAQILSEAAMENLIPTMNAASNPLMFMTGTPPRPIDPGEAFTNRRRMALDGRSADTLYVEFSADRKGNPDSRAQWKKANPSFPDRTSEDAILRMKEALGDDSFKREALGIWDVNTQAGKPKVAEKAWAILESDEVPAGRLVVGVKFSADGLYSALAVAVRPDDGDVPLHVDGLRVASTSEGVAWIVQWLAARKDRVTQIVVDGKGWSPVLIDALVEAGFGVRRKVKRETSRLLRQPSTQDVIDAHGMFLDAVQQEALTHGKSQVLDGQVAIATTRKIGTAGGWGWQSLTDTGNTTLLDAVTFAYWGAKTVTRGRSKGARVI